MQKTKALGNKIEHKNLTESRKIMIKHIVFLIWVNLHFTDPVFYKLKI